MTQIPDKDLRLYAKLVNVIRVQSSAIRAQVGCVIIHPTSRNIVSFGYNGTPAGDSNTCEIDGVTKAEVIHAEINAIRKLSWLQRIVNHDYVAIVSHTPCLGCSQALVNAKIRHVYYLMPYGDGSGVDYLQQHGVSVKRLMIPGG
jgi:dCMP deaminase